MYYLNYFFIFSIFGHLFETIIYKLMDVHRNSGFLYGSWTPVYGMGVVIIIFLSRLLFRKIKIKKIYEILLFMISTFVVLTIIEFLGGHLLYFIFHKNFWNYTDHKYNFGKYIALDVSLIWMVGSVIFLYLIKPWMDKIVIKIPKWITYVLIILMIIDLTFTFISKSKLI